MFKGFGPIYGLDSRILILGSFPSVISRKYNFYYANPRNRFWSVLERIFGDKVPSDSGGRRDYVLAHKIALWDVVSECDIKGSADKDIDKRKLKPNDLKIVLEGAPNIEKIICNGKKAYEVFLQYFGNLGRTAECLPSTSPANTWFELEPWRAALSSVSDSAR